MHDIILYMQDSGLLLIFSLIKSLYPYRSFTQQLETKYIPIGCAWGGGFFDVALHINMTLLIYVVLNLHGRLHEF